MLEDHPGGYSTDAIAAAAAVVSRHAASSTQVTWVVLGAHTAAANFAKLHPELLSSVSHRR